MSSTPTFFSSLSVAAILLQPLTAFAFSDVTTTHIHADAIAYVQSEKIVDGYSDGTFRADATINRAEFTKIIVGATMKTRMDMHCFPDIKDEWFAPFVCTAKSNDIIGGYADGTFRPGSPVNFVEGAKIIARAFHVQSSDTDTNWYTPFVIGLEKKNAIPMDIKTLTQPLTRGQMAEMIYRIRSQNNDKPSKTFEQLTGHAFVDMQTSSVSSVQTSSLARPKTAFPLAIPIDKNWPTSWPIHVVAGAKVLLENAQLKTDDATHPTYLRVNFPAGSVSTFGWAFYELPLGGVVGWLTPDMTPQKHLTLSYDVRVPVDFEYAKGGSLPALMTGLQNNRDDQSAGTAQVEWDKDGYLILEGQLDSFALSGKTTTKLPRDGKWHHIDLEVRLQTATAKQNGFIGLSLDGQLLASANDVHFKNRANDLWDGINFNITMNGNDSASGPTKDVSMDFANISVDSDE